MNLTGQNVYQKGTKRTQRKHGADDSPFLAWIRTQPSALSGLSPCVAAHYRTAHNSGTGIKPLFSAIPLTSEEHARQHIVGQFNFKLREWWEEQVMMYQQTYMCELGRKIPERFLVL